MSKGRRYNKEDNKLNIKKVVAAIIALIVVVMFVLILIKVVNSNDEKSSKAVALGYYTVYENGKWGVINGKGETVIKPTYNEMIIIPNKTKDVFITTYNVDFKDETYKSKAFNAKGDDLFKNYDKVDAIVNYNKQNSLFYYDNCLKVEKNGKYGLIDFSGKQLIDCLYDDIVPVPYLKNSLITIKDDKKGLISSTGAVIINNEYTDIVGLTDAYEDGYIVKNNDGKYGVIGTNKKILVPAEYAEVKNVHSGDFYIVKKDEKLLVFDSSNDSEKELKADDIKSVNGNYIIVKKDSKYGLVNTSGEEVLEAKYQDLEFAFSDYYVAKLDDKFGVINYNDEEKIEFKYDNLVYRSDASFLQGDIAGEENSDLIDRNFEVKLSGIISEINVSKGYMKVRLEDQYKFYNFKFEEKEEKDLFPENTLFLDKKDGKYGYKNKDGIVIVNYIYDDATQQNEYGYVAVKQNGKWGAMDKDGKVIVEPSLELVNNSIIDFIGTWHLSEDINSGFYTK